MENSHIQLLKEKKDEIESLLSKVFQKEMDQLGLSKEQVTLLYLISHTSMNQKEMAYKLHVSEASLSVRMKRLEANGYLIRRQDPQDKRKYQLEMTPQAEKIVEQAMKKVIRIQKTLLNGLTKQDYEALSHVCDVIRENIENIV